MPKIFSKIFQKKSKKNTAETPVEPVRFRLNNAKNTIIEYLLDESHVIVPDEIITIADGAFKNKKLTSIVIPYSCERIGHYAFCGCKNLTSIDLPSSVREIGDFAFKGCKKLSYIELPDSVVRVGKGACNCTAICRHGGGTQY